MRKSAVIGVIVVIVIVAAGLAALATHKKATPAKTNMNMQMAPATEPASSAQPTATNMVSIQDFSFSPVVITVKKGTTVTWTNHDSTAHTVTETDGKDGPKSGDLANGQTYTFTYNSTGTFAYHCSIHSNMTGEVVVTE